MRGGPWVGCRRSVWPAVVRQRGRRRIVEGDGRAQRQSGGCTQPRPPPRSGHGGEADSLEGAADHRRGHAARGRSSASLPAAPHQGPMFSCADRPVSRWAKPGSGWYAGRSPPAPSSPAQDGFDAPARTASGRQTTSEPGAVMRAASNAGELQAVRHSPCQADHRQAAGATALGQSGYERVRRGGRAVAADEPSMPLHSTSVTWWATADSVSATTAARPLHRTRRRARSR